MILLFKSIHIAALILWCAGLLALPLLLAKHREGEAQADYARLRLLSHYGYTRIVTPAAVIAIAAGTVLIFLRDMFVPWLFAKLVVVGLLVALHAWTGHVVLTIAETRGEERPPAGLPLLLGALATMTVVLLIVLAKPVWPETYLPRFLLGPLHRQVPVDEVPI